MKIYYVITILLVAVFKIVFAVDIPLSCQDITSLFKNHVAVNYTDEYNSRYARLPIEKNTNISWLWKGKDLPRVIAVLEFERYVAEHGLKSQKGLGINGKDPEWSYVPNEHVFSFNYHDNHTDYDLHQLKLADNDFDFVMVNQTLEHVYDPLRCLKNIHNHMKKDGIIYFNVPANTIPHDTPLHYYTGFTPVGIGALVLAAGFTILHIGQWGNRDYLKEMFDRNDWPDFETYKGLTTNQIDCPIITWVFAKK